MQKKIANKDNAEMLLGDPFIATYTYIGAGYNVYDALLPPPNITYGEAVYQGTKVPFHMSR